MGFRRVFNVLLPLAFAFSAAGFQSRCAESQGVTGLCDADRSVVFISNHHTARVRVTITDNASHDVVYDEYVDSNVGGASEEETHIRAMTIPAGRSYEVTAHDIDGDLRAITPSTFAVTCTSMQSLVIAEDPLPTLPPEALRPRTFDRALPLAVSECLTRPGDPVENLFIFESISATALGAQILANKAYLENFFAMYFPDALAAAENGEAVHMEVVTVPHTTYDIDGVHTEIITDIKFTVDPIFLGLNNGLSAAGQFSISKQIYMDGDTPVRMASFQANPVERRGSTAFIAYEYHLPHATLDNLEYEDVEFVHYDAEVGSGLEFQLGFIKSRCQDEEAHLMTAFFRDRPVAGGSLGDLPFSSWVKTTPALQNCIMKELNKPLRGTYDFVRRKMMDLSGSDDMLFSWLNPEMTRFEIGYNGTYQCSRDILSALLAELP